MERFDDEGNPSTPPPVNKEALELEAFRKKRREYKREVEMKEWEEEKRQQAIEDEKWEKEQEEKREMWEQKRILLEQLEAETAEKKRNGYYDRIREMTNFSDNLYVHSFAHMKK